MKPIRVVAAAGELAENPLWHPERHCLYWTDIPAGKIHAYEPATGRHRVVYEGQPVGGFTIQDNGDLLLFRVADIARMHPDGRVSVVRTFSDDGMQRFNDVIADPQGRVFAGTFGEHPKCGLYRLDLDGAITRLFSGTGCSNGMGFSPDLKTFYWTCSTTREIFQFDYAAGEICNRRTFSTVPDTEGIPDGLAVDVSGAIWSARWAGASVVRHAADGAVLNRIPFPVVNITSICFGGENLDQLFATSAEEPGCVGETAGSLFQIDLQIRGFDEFRSRIA